MKKVFLFICLFLYGLLLNATTYYIATTGSNSNNGSVGSPWLTLYYACGHTLSGDIIHVNAGTYVETSQSTLLAGVSIEGDGATSIIKSGVGSDYLVVASSATAGTSGNQHIAYVEFDGQTLTGYAAIKIYNRNNVGVYNCTFQNFSNYGVYFGVYWLNNGVNTNEPTTYATGNTFHDNIVNNCSGYFPAGDKNNGEGRGALLLLGQDGMLIYNNTMTQTQRAVGNNGYLIKSAGGTGFTRGLKIHDNTFTKAPYDQETWDFALELWHTMGGTEIYNNTITAAIDFSGWEGATMESGHGYTYSAWVHNNTIGPTSPGGLCAIYFEAHVDNAIIEKNHIQNVSKGIAFNCQLSDLGSSWCQFINTRVSYNIFNIVGVNVVPGGYPEGYGILFNNSGGSTPTFTNLYFYNNVITGSNGTGTAYWGLHIPDSGTASYIEMINNIVEGFGNAVYGSGINSATLNNLKVQNNIFYNNGNNTVVYSGITVTNYTNSNNLTGNPLFVSSSDYHLQATSPAVGSGLLVTTVTLTSDYAGNSINNPPERGVYKFVSGSITIPSVTTAAISNIAMTTSTGGGSVISDGGASITARGVCWATTSNPTTANTHTIDGAGVGSFISALTGLGVGNTYYVRAYGINSSGTGYGANVSFATLTPGSSGTTFVKYGSRFVKYGSRFVKY